MRKNLVYALLAVTLSMLLLALGAPVGLAAQDAASSPKTAAQTQTQQPAAAQPGQSALPLSIPVGKQFMKDTLWFPIGVSPYLQRQVPEPVLTNSPSLQQMIHKGKLELSLQDAIRLAVQNNLNIDVYRYMAWIADAQVLGAKAGANGLNFDPVVTSNLSWSRQNNQISNPYIGGTGTSTITSITSKGAQANFGYSQGFLTGTSFNLRFSNDRSASTSPGQIFNPVISSSLAFSITQPLLQGFGLLPNERLIIEAKNTSQIDRYNLETEVINQIANVESDYWQLAYAIANVHVAQTSVDWAKKNLQDVQRQLQIGTMAQLDVVSAESELATYQQQLINAQTGEQQAQTTLLNLITRNQMAAGLENTTVVPTDSINTPPKVDIIPYRDAVQQAWQDRPDLLAQELTLKNNDIDVKVARNGLLPSLNLTGNYQTSGIAGNTHLVQETPSAYGPDTSQPIVDENGNPVLYNGLPTYVQTPTQYSTQVQTFNAGLLDTWNILWHNDYPAYSFSLSLNLPLHNRAAQASSAEAQLRQRQQTVNVQVLKNSIATNVRNAQIGIQQGLARVQAAVKATQLAQQTLDAEQKKFQLGVSTDYNVILRQRDVATAQGSEILAKAQLLQAIVALNQALGRTMQVNNISITDAATGHVTHAPLIPGTPIKNLFRHTLHLGSR